MVLLVFGMVFNQKHTPNTSHIFTVTTVPIAILKHPSLKIFDAAGITICKAKFPT